jgi:hypothetical protein
VRNEGEGWDQRTNGDQQRERERCCFRVEKIQGAK